MQLKIKQIGSSLMGAVLTGATLLGGALAADISDFQKMGPSNTVVVVGASAASSDVVGAINVGAAMYGHEATATATGGTTTTVEGGVNLATSTRALFLNDKLNAAGKTTITKTDMPTTLASKTFSDSIGTSYKYDQYIELGSTTSQLTYGKPSGQNEPMGYINRTSGTTSVTSSAYTYQTKVVFNDPVNLTSTNVQGQTVTLFGVDYTIGSTSTNTKLVLFGSGNSALIDEGNEASIMVGSTEHKVKIDIVSDSTYAYISVDGGASTKVTNKALYTINGVDVYVNDIIYVSKTGGVSKMKVSLGSGRITLESGQAVKIGTSDTAVDGTKVTITGAPMSTLAVAVGAKDSSSAFIKEGSEYTDPVFGTFKVSFSGYAPKLDDATRDTIAITASGNDRASVKFTDNNGNEKQIDFAKDLATTTTGSQLAFTDGNDKAYHIVEGEAAGTDEYIVADANDMSHLFKVGSISGFDSATGATTTLSDVFSGTSYVFTLDNGIAGIKNGTKTIDGQTYAINVTSASGPVKLTWVAGTDLQRADVSDAATPGATDWTTVFPTIKAKNGEKVYLTNASTITLAGNTTKRIVLPTGTLKLRYTTTGGVPVLNYTVGTTTEAGDPLTAGTAITFSNTTVAVGQQRYNIANATALDSESENVIIRLATGTTASDVVMQPAILLKEKKNINSNYETVLIATSDDSTGIRVDGTPAFSAWSGSGTSTSTSTLTKYLDLWGTTIDRDTTGRGSTTIKVPDAQVTGGVYLMTAGSAAPTTTTTGTGTVNLPSIGSGIAKLDSEISAEKTTKNLILVGGPYANSLVQELAVSGKTPTKDEWFSANLKGKAIIQAIDGAFPGGKEAIVVAGFSAEDSRIATLKLATADKTFKGAAQSEIGGVWSALTYPFAAQNTTTNTTG